MRTHHYILAAACLAALGCGSKQESSPAAQAGGGTYALYSSLFADNSEGKEVSVEVSWDSRLLGREGTQGSNTNPGAVDGPSGFSYLGARLCVRNVAEKQLHCMDLAFPLVKVDLTELKSGSKASVLALWSDESTGMGGYSGNYTRLFTVDAQGQVQPLHSARRPDGSGGEEMNFLSSLKSGFKMAPPSDIYQVECFPDEQPGPGGDGPENAQVGFKTTYRHFHFNGQAWNYLETSRKRLWENEGAFPSPSEFP